MKFVGIIFSSCSLWSVNRLSLQESRRDLIIVACHLPSKFQRPRSGFICFLHYFFCPTIDSDIDLLIPYRDHDDMIQYLSTIIQPLRGQSFDRHQL